MGVTSLPLVLFFSVSYGLTIYCVYYLEFGGSSSLHM